MQPRSHYTAVRTPRQDTGAAPQGYMTAPGMQTRLPPLTLSDFLCILAGNATGNASRHKNKRQRMPKEGGRAHTRFSLEQRQAVSSAVLKGTRNAAIFARRKGYPFPAST